MHMGSIMPKDKKKYISETDFYKNVQKYISSENKEGIRKKKKKTEE